MSETQKQPQPLSLEQRQLIVNKMFEAVHADLGAILKLLTAKPTTDGFFLDTEAVGVASMRLTRGMGAMEKLLKMNGHKPAEKPKVAADGALIGGFAPAPADAPPKDVAMTKSLDSAFASDTLPVGMSLLHTTVLGTVGDLTGATKQPTEQ